MNKLNSIAIAAKIRKDRLIDSAAEKLFSKEKGDSDILTKVIFVVVAIALVMILKWAFSYLLTGSSKPDGSGTYKPDSIMGEFQNKVKAIFDANN